MMMPTIAVEDPRSVLMLFAGGGGSPPPPTGECPSGAGNDYPKFVEAMKCGLQTASLDTLGPLAYESIEVQTCEGGLCSDPSITQEQGSRAMRNLVDDLGSKLAAGGGAQLLFDETQQDVSIFPVPPAIADHTLCAYPRDRGWMVCLGSDHLGGYYITDMLIVYP